MYGVVTLSPAIVEPLIALSIVYVGVENILTRRLHSWRILIVFLFGLLHGLGFAGVLTEIGLPRSDFVTALITFNIGVELGQLTVISVAWVLLAGWLSHHPNYRRLVTVPLSVVISLTGAYWVVTRIAA
jgi:hydrogenase/urease accessory protein HupE